MKTNKNERVEISIVWVAVIAAVFMLMGASIAHDINEFENRMDVKYDRVSEVETNVEELTETTMEYLDSDEYVVDLFTTGEIYDWISEEIGL